METVENDRKKLEKDEVWTQITKKSSESKEYESNVDKYIASKTNEIVVCKSTIETSIPNQDVENTPENLRNATVISEMNNKDSTACESSNVLQSI